jgi:hypothetical protein
MGCDMVETAGVIDDVIGGRQDLEFENGPLHLIHLLASDLGAIFGPSDRCFRKVHRVNGAALTCHIDCIATISASEFEYPARRYGTPLEVTDQRFVRPIYEEWTGFCPISKEAVPPCKATALKKLVEHSENLIHIPNRRIRAGRSGSINIHLEASRLTGNRRCIKLTPLLEIKRSS